RRVKAARASLAAQRAQVEAAQRESDFLRHAVDELGTLAPEAGEEASLAERRAIMQQSEKIARELNDALEALGGQGSAVPHLASAVRRLERRA
ncbi:hypothetical protein, partial [Escherichia coli]